MKKDYIVPESKLYSINLKENIAYSGDDIINANAVISFTHDTGTCRGYYSGQTDAPVHTPAGSSFQAYYDELRSYGAGAYFNCFTYISNT
ncbi:MAG: hypothetical protein ACI3XR_09305 [Eubacteriales bacterium]